MQEKNRHPDPAMIRVREIWAEKQESGWTLQKLGVAMGYGETSARKHAHQFLAGNDPRISSLRRFACAVKIKIEKLVKE